MEDGKEGDDVANPQSWSTTSAGRWLF